MKAIILICLLCTISFNGLGQETKQVSLKVIEMYEQGQKLMEKGDSLKGLRLIKKAAKKGYAKAQCAYGYHLILGDGVKWGKKKGWDWIRKAALQNNPNAQRTLSSEYFMGDQYFPKDSIQGFYWLKKAADNGHFMSQLEVGDYYLQNADTASTIKYYTMAYKISHEMPDYIWKFQYVPNIIAVDQYLAYFYYNGCGTPKDIKAAIEYWNDATDWNDSESAYYVGTLYIEGTEVEQDLPLGLRYLGFAARNGCIDAQAYMGDCCMNGVGMDKDSLAAIHWYKQAAEAGHVGSQRELVIRYNEAEKNDSTIFWGRQPGCRDSTDVQFCLGYAYYAKADYTNAVYWWKKAADGGNGDAYYNLGHVYYLEEFGMQNIPLAIGYWKLGADLNSPQCQYCYGAVLLDGYAIKKDKKQAIHWLKLAANNGSEGAKEELKGMGIEI